VLTIIEVLCNVTDTVGVAAVTTIVVLNGRTPKHAHALEYAELTEQAEA
jgi:hypothetical protein